MKKDISFPKVEGIALTVVLEGESTLNPEWNVYVVNTNEKAITGVLISSKGYGEKNDEPIKTSTLRHFFEVIPPKSYRMVEPIMPELFALSNEYWISYYIDGVIYDKKYVFLAESIKEDNFALVPVLNKKGVMIM